MGELAGRPAVQAGDRAAGFTAARRSRQSVAKVTAITPLSHPFRSSNESLEIN